VRTRKTKTIFTSWVNADVARQWAAYEKLFGPSARSEVAARGYVDQSLFFSRLLDLRHGVERTDLVWLMKVVGLEIWLRTLTLPRDQLVTVSRPSADHLLSRIDTCARRPAITA
jgi:hypothetical protein